MRRYPISVALLALASPVLAQDEKIAVADTVPETSITIVAAGAPETLAESGQAIGIVGGEEIASVQGADIARVLERAPGVSISRNGGVGGFTAVRVRGAEGEHLLVLIDGVRMADPASPGAGFDFGALLPQGIGKIELLRGSNSTIWGSQAIGGVLAVTSAAADGLAASAEYGAHDSLTGSLQAGVRWNGGGAGLAGALVDTAGISAAASGIEPDGLRQWQAGGRASQTVGDWLTLEAAGRFTRARAELDGFPPPDFLLSDTSEYQWTRQASGRIGARLTWKTVELNGGYSLADTRREQFDPALGDEPAYATSGRSERAEVRGKWDLRAPLALRFGAEREWTRFESTFDSRERAATTGFYAQAGYNDGRLAANAGLRRDDHSGFGGEWSLGADARLRIFDGWNVHASYGEGFKAPSLFQMFSDFGNPALRAERSRSFDLGIGKGDRNSRGAYFDLTLFRRDTRGLIGFVSCFGRTDGICEDRPFGTYDNIGKARARGVEVEGGVRPLRQVGLSAAYAYVEAEDRTQGAATFRNHLARRPGHALTVTGEWRAGSGLTLAADLRVVSGSFDDAANMVRMDGYEVLTLRAGWDVSDTVALFGRVENLWDERYETAAGYGTPGRGAYLGARARW